MQTLAFSWKHDCSLKLFVFTVLVYLYLFLHVIPGVLQYTAEQPEVSAQSSSHHHRQTHPSVLQQEQGQSAGEHPSETFIFFSLLSSWHTLSVIHYTRSHPCWHRPAVCFCCPAAQTVPVHHGVSAVPDPPGEGWQSLPGAGSSAGCGHTKWHPSSALAAEQCKCVSNSHFCWLSTLY